MLRATYDEVSGRAERLQIPFNRLGVDPYGISRSHVRRMAGVLCCLYRHYFSVHVDGIERVPEQGRAMLVGNHSGGIPLDGAMVAASVFLELDPPRLVQGMVERFFSALPYSSIWTSKTGQFTGLPEHAVRLLKDDRLLLVFPEGARGTAKLYPERNSLVSFGTGFMRLALQTRSPIVPFGFVGGGNAVPTVVNLYGLAKLIGTPYVPLTPYLLPLPLPVRLDIVYGEPLHFEGSGREDDEVIFGYVEEVKSAIAALIERGRRSRRGDDGWPRLAPGEGDET